MTVALPNVRKLFIPDPGYMLFDADLAGADAQVVAAESSDTDLLKAFEEGLDVHVKNATDLWGSGFTSLVDNARYQRRQQCKQAVHGTNYGAHPKTLSTILGWSVREAQTFQDRWFALHPGIKEWHRRVDSDLRDTRIARNRFGYRIIYFDRIEALLPQALAWIPQSTVALTAFRGALQLEQRCSEVEILLQVHDSVVFQVPFRFADSVGRFKEALTVPIPYDPPLTIQWGLARSEKSWGDCEKVSA
jgi:DNA polymerase-1